MALDHNFYFPPFFFSSNTLKNFRCNFSSTFVPLRERSSDSTFHSVACEGNNAVLCIQRVAPRHIMLHISTERKQGGKREKNRHQSFFFPSSLRTELPASSRRKKKVILSNLSLVITHRAVELAGVGEQKVFIVACMHGKRLKLCREGGGEKKK